MIILAVTIPIKPELRAEAIEIALEMSSETLKEPGVIAYTFHSPLDNPNTFFVYEEWASQDALDFHNSSPHMKVFQGKISEVLAGDVSLSKYEVS